MARMRDHGGDLDKAKMRYGGHDWIDLSTGINRRPYPLPPLPPDTWTALPSVTDITALENAAARAYGTKGSVVALAGAQAIIQIIPRLAEPGHAAVLAPSYNEHAAALAVQGWTVASVPDPSMITGANLAIIVNPNNPDGRRWRPEALRKLAKKVDRLVIDESFIDAESGLSLAPFLSELGERVIILRSFGKFYGLAGVRLGFALAGPETAARIRALAGPWAVSGPAITIGKVVLSDNGWHAQTTVRLHTEVGRLAALVKQAGWGRVGGTPLFITAETGNARYAQERLASACIWTRIFPYSKSWLRLGLPGNEKEWARLQQALARSGE